MSLHCPSPSIHRSFVRTSVIGGFGAASAPLLKEKLDYMFDKNNREVKIGSWVKVLFIHPGFISTFPHNEARKMSDMINKTFEVIAIEHGKALISQSFSKYHGFTLALAPEEMELASHQ